MAADEAKRQDRYAIHAARYTDGVKSVEARRRQATARFVDKIGACPKCLDAGIYYDRRAGSDRPCTCTQGHRASLFVDEAGRRWTGSELTTLIGTTPNSDGSYGPKGILVGIAPAPTKDPEDELVERLAILIAQGRHAIGFGETTGFKLATASVGVMRHHPNELSNVYGVPRVGVLALTEGVIEKLPDGGEHHPLNADLVERVATKLLVFARTMPQRPTAPMQLTRPIGDTEYQTGQIRPVSDLSSEDE